MAVPKRKQSNARTGSRRAHDRIAKKAVVVCPKCSNTVLTHAICPDCGYYMGRVVSPVEESEEAKP